jgi:hypothetical protein
MLLRNPQIHTDPHTGQETKRKRLGGAYPGQRRPQHAPYQPPGAAFGNGDQATAHFVSYGGGNALVLQNSNGPSRPEQGIPGKDYIQGKFVDCGVFFPP